MYSLKDGMVYLYISTTQPHSTVAIYSLKDGMVYLYISNNPTSFYCRDVFSKGWNGLLVHFQQPNLILLSRYIL
jgi:hypothetical protein